MAQLTRQTGAGGATPAAAITPNYQTTAAGGDLAPIGGGKTFLYFRNTNAAARNVTLARTVQCNEGVQHNPVVNVPLTTGDVLFGPIDPLQYGDANGNVALTYDAVTNLTVAVITL